MQKKVNKKKNLIKENKFYLFLSGFLKKYLSKTVWVHPFGCAAPNNLLCI